MGKRRSRTKMRHLVPTRSPREFWMVNCTAESVPPEGKGVGHLYPHMSHPLATGPPGVLGRHMPFQGSSDKAASIIVQGSPPGKSCWSESRVAAPAAAEGWAHRTRKEAPWKETGPLSTPWDEIKVWGWGGVNALPWGPFLFGFLHHVSFPVSASGSLD